MESQEIGHMVHFFRKKSGLSQRELADLAGIGKTAVFDIEKGKETIQLNTLLKVLNALNIQLNFITPFKQSE